MVYLDTEHDGMDDVIFALDRIVWTYEDIEKLWGWATDALVDLEEEE